MSNLNDPIGKNFLGIVHKNGDGVRKNIFNAIEYFNEGIKLQDDVISHYNLARIFYFGIDSIPKDVEKSIKLLEEASKRKLMAAKVFLFFIFTFGENEFRDIEKASKYQRFENLIPLCESNPELVVKIFNFFKQVDLLFKGDEHFKRNFIYFIENGCKKQYHSINDNKKKLRDIDKNFYEGLNIPYLCKS